LQIEFKILTNNAYSFMFFSLILNPNRGLCVGSRKLGAIEQCRFHRNF